MAGVRPQSNSAPWYITGTASFGKVPCTRNGATKGDSATTAFTSRVRHAGHAPPMARAA